MHELGVVFHIVKSVKEIAEENALTKINSVTLEIGEVSTIIPSYLTDCWKWAVGKEEGPVHDATLKVEQIDAVTYCEDCKKQYPTVEFGKTCPHCGSERTYLVSGNEVNIKEIEAV